MELKRKLTQLVCSLIVLGSCLPFAVAQTQANDARFIDGARNSYSMLKRQGLVEARASVVPNWTMLLADVKQAEKPAAMRLANRLRFAFVVNADGQIQVTHTVIGPKPNKTTGQALDTMAKGVELSVTGFLMSWAPFMLTHLIPENLEHFVLQDVQSGRVLNFNESGVDVTVALTRDYEITELRTPQGTVKPRLKRTDTGFILTGYEGNNEDPYIGRVILNTRVDSALTQGMLLPKTVFINGSAAQTPINFELHFTNYRLKMRI